MFHKYKLQDVTFFSIFCQAMFQKLTLLNLIKIELSLHHKIIRHARIIYLGLNAIQKLDIVNLRKYFRYYQKLFKTPDPDLDKQSGQSLNQEHLKVNTLME